MFINSKIINEFFIIKFLKNSKIHLEHHTDSLINSIIKVKFYLSSKNF